MNNTTKTLTYPTIHMNGTSKGRLGQAYSDAYAALYDAAEKLRQTAPNGRDYYPAGPEAMSKAEAEHRSRQQRIADVMDELETLASHCV